MVLAGQSMELRMNMGEIVNRAAGVCALVDAILAAGGA
jgi:hypothetical protein